MTLIEIRQAFDDVRNAFRRLARGLVLTCQNCTVRFVAVQGGDELIMICPVHGRKVVVESDWAKAALESPPSGAEPDFEVEYP